MNRNFGKVVDFAIQYAPDAISVNGRLVLWPKEAALYAAADDGPWIPVAVDVPPAVPPREGYHWEHLRPVEEDGEIRWQYAEVADPPPPPRTFRKSWLAQWIYANGKWPRFVAFLDSPDAQGISFLWGVCTEFDEDNPAWPGAVIAIKEALALTDAEADAMLDFGATGGQP